MTTVYSIMKNITMKLSDDVIYAAITIAEISSWESVRLFDIATVLNIDLDDIRHFFREKDEIIDAYFDLADKAMLNASTTPNFILHSSQKRLHILLMAWLNTFKNHKHVVRQMIYSKLEPGHIHIQIPALLRVSRTVQWWREAAERQATLPYRAIEETALTAIYLSTFCYWLFDNSHDASKTQLFLKKKLYQVGKLSHIFCSNCK